MRKSILRFGALALMSLMSIGVFAQEFETSDGSKYKVNGDGWSVTLTKAKAGMDAVPGSVQDSDQKSYTVTAIGEKAFWNGNDQTGSTLTTSITAVASTVVKVENYAFKGVTSLTVNPAQFTSIGNYAFENVAFTANVGTVGSPLALNPAAAVGEGAFKGTDLVAVKWTNTSLTAIPKDCFSGCTTLTTFVFSKTLADQDFVTEIGQSAFSGCKALVNFGWYNSSSSTYYLPSTLATIGAEAFKGCLALTGLQFLGTVTPSIQTVNRSAFNGCTALSNDDFAIFKNVSTIESGAFSGCTALTNVAIPEKVKGFTDSRVKTTDTYVGVFEDCTELATVKFHTDFGKDNGSLGTNTFNGCIKLAKLTDFDKTAITSITEGAFQNALAVGTDSKGFAFTLPANVTTIGKNAFNGSNIKSINWNKVTSIVEGAFQDATLFYADGDAKVSLPNINAISKNAFEGTTFKVINIPVSVTSIGESAFASNTAITNINIAGTPNVETHTPKAAVTCSANSFATLTSAALEIPYGSYDLYNADQSNWNKITGLTIATRPAKYAQNGTFYASGLQYKVTKNDGKSLAEVEVIGGLYERTGNKDYTEADEKDTKADWKSQPVLGTEITVPEYVHTNLDGNNAYYKVTAISALYTESELTKQKASPSTDYELSSIGGKVAAVATVDIKAPGLAIPAVFKVHKSNNVEVGFKGLATFKAKSIKSLAASTFENCAKLSDLSGLSYEQGNTNTFTTIPASAFKGCKALTSYTVPGKVIEIAANAFEGSGLTSVDLSADLETIGEAAFKDVVGLKSVALPGKLESIGASAFDGSGLTLIDIPASVTTIGANAFTYTNKDGKEAGVKDVIVNWEKTGTPLAFPTLTITDGAFGAEQSSTDDFSGTEYYCRNLYIPAGAASDYLSTTFDKTFNNPKLFTTIEGIKVNGKNVRMTPSEKGGFPSVTLEDKVAGNGVESVEIKSNLLAEIEYVRTITDDLVGKWQCWFVPFEVKAQNVEGATFAKIWNTRYDEATNSVSIEIKKVSGSELIKANTCYVVKFDKAEENKTIKADTYRLYPTVFTTSKSPFQFTVSNTSTVFTFEGLYKKDTATSDKDFYIVNKNGNFQFLGKDKNVYAYRFKMTPSNNASNPYNVKFVVLDDEDATSIENVKANSLNAPMFDLMGRQITSPAKGQVYIQNGVKKLAK